jgi:hypothetical protein
VSKRGGVLARFQDLSIDVPVGFLKRARKVAKHGLDISGNLERSQRLYLKINPAKPVRGIIRTVPRIKF